MTQLPTKRRFIPGSALVPLALALTTILSSGTSALAGQNVTAPTSANIGRKVQVQATINPLFSLAIACKTSFNMNGNNCLVDSFNSSLATASTNGQYDPTKALSGGDVGVDGAFTGAASTGNGDIYGHLFTGAGSLASQVQIGANGSIGPVGTANGTISPGYWSPTFNASFPDVTVPSPYVGLTPSGVSGGTYILSGGVKYIWNGANNNYFNVGTLIVNGLGGPTTLWVQGSMYFGNIVLTNGGSLVLYLGTTAGTNDWITDTGNSTVNQPGLASNVQIYGLHSLDYIAISGNAGFTCTIYAPEAALTGGGGGHNTQNFDGAVVVNSCSLNGHWAFHFDESLKNYGPTRGWIAKNWTEMTYP